jgi:hypothetical protein
MKTWILAAFYPMMAVLVFLSGCADVKVARESAVQSALNSEGRQFVTVRPQIIDDVLTNPGMGFMTFQRFEGDKLDPDANPSEGFPIDYDAVKNSNKSGDFPSTSIAYFRIYWRFVEPSNGEYHWELIDDALRVARQRHQTLMLRLPPYGPDEKSDVPAWYRVVSKESDFKKKLPDGKWLVDPENPAYIKYFGRLIRAFGKRYNGNSDIEAVDVAILGAWGEGSGTTLLKTRTRNKLIDAYFDSFTTTPLLMQITDRGSFDHARERRGEIGWRIDCLGDVGLFGPTWAHMYDYYPEQIVHLGIQDNWRTAPVSMEVCGILGLWKEKHLNIDYIIDQSLKWHISSFNAKSSAVPKEWWPQVNRWLKKMGYRFALRKFVFPAQVAPGGVFEYSSWWENLGVAPCYRNYPVALKLKGSNREVVLATDSDIRKWLPGDSLLEGSLHLPKDLPEGNYEVTLALVDPITHTPRIWLASQGREPDGWYKLGQVRISFSPPLKTEVKKSYISLCFRAPMLPVARSLFVHRGLAR